MVTLNVAIYYIYMLHVPYGFREDFICFVFSYYKSMANNDIAKVWPILAPSSKLAGITKRITKHCYLNI